MLAAAYAEAIIEAREKVALAKAELQRLGNECKHWECTDPVPQTIISKEFNYGGYHRQQCLVSCCKTCGIKRTEFLEDNSVEYGEFWV